MERPLLEIPATIDVPLRRDPDDTIRIGNPRVLLEVLIGFYKQGDSPEALHEGFPTVSLLEIYAVITYYLTNREQVDAYIEWVHQEGERIRREFEAQFPPKPFTRAMLEARMEEKRRLQELILACIS
jgi:uncharacterized protein (DUF433 family)